jgi:Tfp pilus assembly protein PilV
VRTVALVVLAVGVLGLACSLAGAANQKLPRKFTATQRQQLTDWEYGQRWRTLAAGTIFPATVSYTAPSALDDDPSLSLSAYRVGIAGQAACAAVIDPAAAAVLDRDGCSAVLRATYVDGTGSYVVTVGAAVLPGSAKAAAAAAAITGKASADGLGPTVHTVQFRGTPAEVFTNGRRQLSGAVSAGSYVILYTVGYTDNRPREPVSGDSYADGEMTSAGAGVAGVVQSVLGAPVRSPGCPGTPGC